MTVMISHSLEETHLWGVALGQKLQKGSILCFHGDLGAGKTTLIKGIAEGYTGIDPSLVNSPTFVYLNIYRGQAVVYHFDLYRLHSADEFLSMGFDDYFFSDGVCCIEWSEKIAEILPDSAVHIYIQYQGEHARLIEIKGE